MQAPHPQSTRKSKPQLPSLDDVNNAIKTTNFIVVRKPGLTPHLTRIRPPAIPHIPNIADIEAYFEATLPTNFFEHLVTCTNNKYNNIPEGPITLVEVRHWLGQTIVLMVFKLRSNRDLFMEGEYEFIYANKQNGLNKHRWEWINSHLEYNPKELQNILLSSWQMHLIPGIFLTCDESRIRAHTRNRDPLSFNKDKPEKWALESHTLNDVATSYLLNFDLPKENSAFQSLHKLTAFLPKSKTFHITSDKHFGNVKQGELLSEKNLYFTLNCKGNSKPGVLWKGGLSVGLPKGKARFAVKDDIVATSFHRKGRLNIVSNFFTVTEVEESRYKERNKLLQHYDDTKRGGDQFNQLVSNFHNDHSHYTIAHTQLNGWIEWALANGFILYKHNNLHPTTHRDYLLYISKYLLK